MMTEYIVTFRQGVIHPFLKVNMDGRGVKVFAPDKEALRIVCNARFGKTWRYAHDPKKIDRKRFIPNGIIETLAWKEPKNSRIVLHSSKK